MKKLLVVGFTTKIACPTGSFRVLVYPSGVGRVLSQAGGEDRTGGSGTTIT